MRACIHPIQLDSQPHPPTPPPSHNIHGRFREKGVSDRLYREAFEPMLLVGLFAPGEQCSAAGALGMLYYFILAVRVCTDRWGMCWASFWWLVGW